MITKEQINNLSVGIYRFDWATGGNSIVAVGVDRDGNRWIAPLNWVSPGDINDIDDGTVINYARLIDRKGFEPDNFEKINTLIDRSESIILKLQEESNKNKIKIRRDMRTTAVFYSVLGLICLGAFIIAVL